MLQLGGRQVAGLQANRDFQLGDVVVYYRMCVFSTKFHPWPEKGDPLYGIVNKDIKNIYSMKLRTRFGSGTEAFFGDISPLSVKPAEREVVGGEEYYIPYWGYFANEPTDLEEWNVELDHDPGYNFEGAKHSQLALKENGGPGRRVRLAEGEYVRYRLVARKPIANGEPILWCYGGDYPRNYETACNDQKEVNEEIEKNYTNNGRWWQVTREREKQEPTILQFLISCWLSMKAPGLEGPRGPLAFEGH